MKKEQKRKAGNEWRSCHKSGDQHKSCDTTGIVKGRTCEQDEEQPSGSQSDASAESSKLSQSEDIPKIMDNLTIIVQPSEKS